MSEANGDEALARVLGLTADASGSFASLPRATRFSKILEAVVPSRRDNTYDKVAAIVRALVDTGAVRADEAGQMFDALMERVSRYNSTNVQTNLERLAQDVREAVAQKERLDARANLGSLASLNAFLASLPAAVERGQEDYVGFLGALRVMVAEVPQCEVYAAGPNFYFQTSRGGSHTVNLTQAMQNLRPLWGVKAPEEDAAAAASLLTPNTRLLLLLTAPFTDSTTVSRDSYVGHLLTLYRETLRHNRVQERTFNEITSVSRALGQGDGQELQATLNFLLTNRRRLAPEEYALSETEERVLRYVQQSVALQLMRDGVGPSEALDRTSANFEPSFYAAHRGFVNRLMDFLHRAAAMNPDYFTNVILNSRWLPPPGFHRGEFDLPEEQGELLWDDEGASLLPPPAAPEDKEPPPALRSRASSLSDLGAAAPRDVNLYVDPLGEALPAARAVRVDRPRLPEQTDYALALHAFPPREGLANNSIDSLVDKFSRWKTYAQEQREQRSDAGARPRKRRARDAVGQGLHDRFAHLRPRGLRF